MLRRLLLAAAALGFVSLLCARAPTAGFDVPWKASREQAIEIMAKQHRARFVSRLSSDTLLLFKGGTWEDWGLQNLQLSFVDGGYVRGTAFFADRDGDPPDFEAVASVLAEEYGRPASHGTAQASWQWSEAGQPAVRIDLAMVPAGLRLTFALVPPANPPSDTGAGAGERRADEPPRG